LTDDRSPTTLEATQGQIDGFFSQLPYKCHQNQVIDSGFAHGLPPGWEVMQRLEAFQHRVLKAVNAAHGTQGEPTGPNPLCHRDD